VYNHEKASLYSTMYMEMFVFFCFLATDPKYDVRQFHADTEVYMGELTPRIIQAYVDTGEPM